MNRPAPRLEHPFPFDPTYGYDLAQLLDVQAPAAPGDFADFWRQTFTEASQMPLNLSTREVECPVPGYHLYHIQYDSLGAIRIGAWVTVPTTGELNGGWVVGHGYGGRQGPNFDLPLPAAPAVFFCARGFDRSAHRSIPNDAMRHVRHGIESRETYVLRGCVADIWGAASALIQLYPEAGKNLRYFGGSFGGGLGALALPWDDRFHRGFLDVPTFGNHPFRLTVPCVGSGESVRLFHARHPEVTKVLRYYDAAVAATFIKIPVCVAAAMFDPAVVPPGQFCVYNSLGGPKELYIRTAAHFSGPLEEQENAELHAQLNQFFQ
ncbi:acetylxylan esterase [soil metagenome]